MESGTPTPAEAIAAVQAALRSRGQSVGCAESLTGGELAAALTAVPGASCWFTGGIVSYASEIKRAVLKVRAEQVISAECAEQMAAGARRLLGSDWALSTTGVAGPDRQEGAPVGTVYVGLAGPGVLRSQKLALTGQRGAIRESTVAAAISLLACELGCR